MAGALPVMMYGKSESMTTQAMFGKWLLVTATVDTSLLLIYSGKNYIFIVNNVCNFPVVLYPG